MKVLWLSPTLNHYKAKFLNKLQTDYPLDITVLAGTGREGEGDPGLTEGVTFELIQLPVAKKNFGFSQPVRSELKRIMPGFDWIMIPKENKNLLLFLAAMCFRVMLGSSQNKPQFFSYNHSLVLSGVGKSSFLDRLVARFYYSQLDKVIFYTETGHDRMVAANFISNDKAFWANNTIDTNEIDANYSFSYPNSKEPTILFIGRMVERKNVPLLLQYYDELRNRPKLENLKLLLIGDGPELEMVKKAAASDANIEWYGALTSESDISPLMSRASLVMVLGHSGLSVNHALCYGRPFVTLGGIHQPPEIDYLKHGENGFILQGNQTENVERIASMLVNFDPELYKRCYATGKVLSVGGWCQRIYKALQQ